MAIIDLPLDEAQSQRRPAYMGLVIRMVRSVIEQIHLSLRYNSRGHIIINNLNLALSRGLFC